MDADDIEDLKTDILRQATANAPPIPFWDMVQGFYHAVDWSEPWIIGLGVVHVALFLTVVCTRRMFKTQAVLFLLMCAAVRCAEMVNTALGHRWRSFSTQNYFDPRGVFASVMFSAPILLTLVVQLISTVFLAGEMLIKVKRVEVRQKARDAARPSADAASAASDPSAKKDQ